MPPEILGTHDPYNYKVDVYAFSFFAYELITGKKPFPDNQFKTKFKLMNAISKGVRPNLKIIENENIRNFLSKCWAPRPSDRPSFLQIVDEIMQQDFKKSFGITKKEDIQKVENYLKLFDDDLKSPNSKDALDMKKEADNGNIAAILAYGHMLFVGQGAITNKEEAFKYFKKAADLGNSYGMYECAYCLRHGFGIQQNIKEAVKYYKMSSEKGNSIAMINLAHMYRNGDEIPCDKNEAVRYYTMSAMKGHINAMFNLGAMFYTGEGIPQNKEEGFKFLKMAASFGHEQAMYLLADILLEDPNTEEEGINYLKMSAEKGYVNSMIKYIGIKMYKDGLDYSDPYLMRYIKMAADHGDMTSKLLC